MKKARIISNRSFEIGKVKDTMFSSFTEHL